MRIIGLTGSIAMGKSATSKVLKREGCAIYDADGEVHRMYAPGGSAVKPVTAAFGDDILDARGGIDRTKLGPKVIGNAEAFHKLEAIVHPLLSQARRQLMDTAARNGVWAFVLDVPLLMETDGDKFCDQVLVVSAPSFLQRYRALRRPDMNPAKLDAILDKQIPDREKRKRADQVIDTGLGHDHALKQVLAALEEGPTRRRGQPAMWRPGLHQKLAGKP